ncbi:hypothetical protein [Arthrobacter sp. NPDC090010]|uniref:PGAP1-like alpha/beta domain-containing protein n=1 Tax=Arthrobacter sp. NPDC090010 TaxID=3363942 RepID=UPI00380AD9A1
MDIEQGKSLSRSFRVAAERLDFLGRELTPIIASSPWSGPDGQRFKSDWNGHRQVLMSTSRALREASQTLQHNIDEQQFASSAATSGVNAPLPGESPWQWYGRLLASGESNGSEAKSSRGVVGGLLHGAKDKVGGLLHGAKDKAEDVVDGAKDTAEHVADGAQDGFSWLRDRGVDVAEGAKDGAGNAWDWAKNGSHSPLNNIPDAVGDVLNDSLDLAKLLQWDPLVHGELPSISQVLAGATKLTGSGLNLGSVLFSGGINHPHILDDGHPTAGPPVPVGVGSGGSNTPVPEHLEDILGGVTKAYGDEKNDGSTVRITEVNKPGQGPAYIVSIPGTESWDRQTGDNPLDLTGNLTSVANGESTATKSIELALDQAGIPRDAPVLLVGHSQGGIIAADLASNDEFTDKYNVTNLITYGSPIDSVSVPDNIDAVAIQHDKDVVPRLDLGNHKFSTVAGVPLIPFGSENNATVVDLKSPAGIGDPKANHDYGKYATSVGEAEKSGPLNDYKNLPSTQRFLTDDPAQVSSTKSQIGRKQ